MNFPCRHTYQQSKRLPSTRQSGRVKEPRRTALSHGSQSRVYGNRVGFMVIGASLVAQRLKHLPTMLETWVRSLGQEDPLEKEMATHSSILAWRTPWTEEPGRLQSTGSQRVGHDWATSFMVIGLAFLSLVNHLTCTHSWSNSRPFLTVCTSLSQDGFQPESFWEVDRTYYGLASPFSSWPLPHSPS